MPVTLDEPGLDIVSVLRPEGVIRVRKLGEAFDRLAILADGTINTGSGSVAPVTSTVAHSLNGGGTTPVIVRSAGDGIGDGFWNVQHAGTATEPYIFHLTHVGTGGACIGIGVSPTTTGVIGLLIDNYTKGIGLMVQNTATISDAAAYGIYGDQRSPIAPLVRLAGLPADSAPLLQLVGAPNGTTHIFEAYYNGGSGLAGYIDGVDGALLWRAPLVAESGDPRIRVNATVSLHEVLLSAGNNIGATLYSYSGSPGYWYAGSVRQIGDELHLQAASAVAAKNSEVMLDGVVVKGGAFTSDVRLGFYGATPTVKQTGVAVSTAGIHAALVTLGLIAA